MLKPCKACEHPERGAVEEALGRGESYKELTKQFGISIGTMKRHRKGHIGRHEQGRAEELEPGGEQPTRPRFIPRKRRRPWK